MRKSNFLFFLLAVMLCLTSCANYKMHVTGEPIQTPPADLGEPEHTMFLIGDAGEAELGEVPPAVRFLGKKLTDAPKNSSVIFLGDNIYPAGFPNRSDPARELAQHRIDVQIDILKNFKGKPFFIPGNHDWWQKKRRKGVERVEDYIEEKLDRGNVWLPDNGCAGPEAVDVSKNVVVLFADSEWFVMNWNKERELNEGCDVKSRESFHFFMQNEIKKNRRKNIVIAMHHPFYTNGSHGGRFSAKQYLFPLTDFNPKLYVPLPGLGFAFQFLRATVGSAQDVSHPLQRELKKFTEGAAQKNGSFIFVSGHEHALEYFEANEQSYIVSGAGSKTSPVGGGNQSQFAYSGEQGFSILKFYPDGETFLEFWTVSPDGENGKMVFSRQIKGKLPAFETELPASYEVFEQRKDSVSLALNANINTGKVHQFFLGEHYRKAYITPVKAPVLDLSVWKGGVKPLKRGGGSQTNSLRVEDPTGKQWVLRSMVKDESRIVPYPYNKTFAKDLFADQFTSANPYIAFTIPKMAKAIGIYYTTPKLFYVPKQPTLGEYNDLFGDGFYLVEERADGDWSNTPNFGFSKDLVTTFDLLDKKEKNAKHRLDAPFTVRTRLFDNLIGDWDRHDDNWCFAAFKDEKTGIITYRPVPRDRDQPFSKYDGAIPAIVRQGIPVLKQFRVYKSYIPDIKWVNYHSKYFDPTFLNECEWSQWEKEAKHIQTTLTDAVIDSALLDFPKEIHAIDAAWIAARLKGRRDNFMGIARDFYLLVSKDVDVVGTDKHDLFTVDRVDSLRTLVQVFTSDKEGTQGELYYQRTFLETETRSVNLYGLDQEDHFRIRGKASKGIIVRCIGGLDNDVFTDESSVKRGGRHTYFYDTKTGNELNTGTEAFDRTSNDPVLNTYDRRSWDTEHNYWLRYPFLSGNPDDGIAIGAGAIYTTFGFKKAPYAARHNIFGKIAFETKGYAFKYGGEFIHALDHWDFLLNANAQGPLFTRNFYGFGNESPNWLADDTEDSENFVRVRQSLLGVYPAFRRQLSSSFSFQIGANAERVKLENNFERLVNTNNPEIRSEAFKNIRFAGSEIQFNFLNADNLVNPSLGLQFNATGGWKKNLDETDRNMRYLSGYLGVWLGGKRVVFASKIGGKHIMGDYEFYQGATLGASENLRGFRNERFTGHSSLYLLNDLRIRLLNVENYVLPFTFGVLGGYDYGRVWVDNDPSDKWHDSYGGGLWLSPFDLVMLTFSYFHSDDGNRFQFRGGFAF